MTDTSTTRPALPPCRLTRREHQVLHLVTLGLSNVSIAQRLHIEETTVDSHMGRIFSKLDLRPDANVNRRVRVAVLYREAVARAAQRPELASRG